MLNDLFASLDNMFNPILASVTTRLVANAISSMAPVITTMLSLYVIMWGGLLAWRQCSRADLFDACARAAVVSLLCTFADYDQYVAQMFTVQIPQFIGTSLSGAGNNLTVPQQFDLLLNSIWHLLQAALGMAEGVSVTQVAERLAAWACVAVSAGVMMLAYIQFKIAAVMVALLVVVGPFVVGLGLFPPTRGIAWGWGKSLIGVMVQMVMINIVTAAAVQVMRSFVLQVAQSGGTLDLMIIGLLQCALVNIFAYSMLRFIPSLAASIVSGAAGIPMSHTTGATTSLVGAGVASARAATAAAKAATGAIRGRS